MPIGGLSIALGHRQPDDTFEDFGEFVRESVSHSGQHLPPQGDWPPSGLLYMRNHGVTVAIEPTGNLVQSQAGRDAMVKMIAKILREGRPDYFAWTMTALTKGVVEPITLTLDEEDGDPKVMALRDRLQAGETIRKSDLPEEVRKAMEDSPDEMVTTALFNREGAVQLWGAQIWRVHGSSPMLDVWRRIDDLGEVEPGAEASLSGAMVEPFVKAMTA